jgi:hypothetical protein
VKDTWYGDKRDLVKWGALVHLACREDLDKIIQVAFLRRGDRPLLETGHGEVAVAEEVWDHFRDVESVESLKTGTRPVIRVLAQPFDPSNRQGYVDHVTDILRQHEHQKKVVLLDPDTGMEPRRARAEHVKEEEVRRVWDALADDDWLVVYQHGFRRTDWRGMKKRQFERICSRRQAEAFQSTAIASDVVLFAVKK